MNFILQQKNLQECQELKMEKIYTIPEIAEYLQLSRSKLYKMVKRGDIPHFNNRK